MTTSSHSGPDVSPSFTTPFFNRKHSKPPSFSYPLPLVPYNRTLLGDHYAQIYLKTTYSQLIENPGKLHFPFYDSEVTDSPGKGTAQHLLPQLFASFGLNWDSFDVISNHATLENLMMSYVIPYDFYIQVRRINGKLCLRKIRESAFTQQSGNSILATMGLLFEERATTPVYADRSTPDEHEQFSLDMTSNLSCNGETLRLYYSAEIDSFLPNHSREWQPVNAPSPKTAVSRHFLPNQPGQLPRFNVRTNRLYFQMSKTDREKAFDFVGTDPLSQDRHRLLLKTLSTIPPLPSAVEIKMVKKNGNQRYWESKFQKVFAQCYTAGILNAFFGYQTIHRSPPAEPKPKTLSVDQYEFFTLPELLDHSRLDLSRCLWNMFHTLKWLGTVAPTDGSSVLAVFSVETREFHIEAFPQDLFDHDLPTLHDWSFVDTLLAPTLSLRGIPKSCSDVEGIIRSTVDPASLVKVSVSDDAVNSSSLMALLTFTTHQSLQQATSALKGALFDGQNVTCSPVS